MMLNKADKISDDIGDVLVGNYHRYRFRKTMVILLLLAVLFIFAGVALTLGGRDIGFFEAYDIIWKHICGAGYEPGSAAWWDDYTVWNYRIPRVFSALVAGFGLAVGGVAMQSITGNPLADPFTTGMSSGAMFGVTVALASGFTLTFEPSEYSIMINAFVFGMVPAVVVVLVTRYKKQSPATIILAGVAISYFFNSLSTLLLARAEESTIKDAFLWQLGTLERVTWVELPLMAAVVAAGTLALSMFSRKLNLLALGNSNARTLGLDTETFRIIILLLLAVMTASIISFTGIIGFLGLVSPHIMRALLGSDNRFILPAAGLFGATLLLVADTLGRTVILPYIIPVGVVMAFMGAPLFLMLIIKFKKDVW
jgi:iron complex transport system permease protein